MSISCRTHCICPPGAQHKCTERRDIEQSVFGMEYHRFTRESYRKMMSEAGE